MGTFLSVTLSSSEPAGLKSISLLQQLSCCFFLMSSDCAAGHECKLKIHILHAHCGIILILILSVYTCDSSFRAFNVGCMW